MSRAREAMRKAHEQTIAEHSRRAVATYESIIRSPKSTNRDRIRAQEGLVSLLGLAGAQKFVVHHEAAERKEDIDRRIDAVFGIVRRPTPAPETNGHSNGNGHHENGANGNGHVDTEAQEATA